MDKAHKRIELSDPVIKQRATEQHQRREAQKAAEARRSAGEKRTSEQSSSEHICAEHVREAQDAEHGLEAQNTDAAINNSKTRHAEKRIYSDRLDHLARKRNLSESERQEYLREMQATLDRTDPYRQDSKREAEASRLPTKSGRLAADTDQPLQTNKSKQEHDHLRNYYEFRDQFHRDNIHFTGSTTEYVDDTHIISPEAIDTKWDQRKEDFWNHHGNSFDDYNRMAEKYRIIQQELAHGKTLDELRLNQDLRSAVDFWWSKSEPVKLIKYKDTYWVDSGFHRVTLAKNNHLGAIPAEVAEASQKRST